MSAWRELDVTANEGLRTCMSAWRELAGCAQAALTVGENADIWTCKSDAGGGKVVREFEDGSSTPAWLLRQSWLGFTPWQVCAQIWQTALEAAAQVQGTFLAMQGSYRRQNDTLTVMQAPPCNLISGDPALRPTGTPKVTETACWLRAQGERREQHQ